MGVNVQLFFIKHVIQNILSWNYYDLCCMYSSLMLFSFLFRHDNMQILEKMKNLVIFIERTLEDKVTFPFCVFILKSFFELYIQHFLTLLQKCCTMCFSIGSFTIFQMWNCSYGSWLRCLPFVSILIQEVIQLSFYSQPDGHVMGNGSFQSSILIPGYAFYLLDFFQQS